MRLGERGVGGRVRPRGDAEHRRDDGIDPPLRERRGEGLGVGARAGDDGAHRLRRRGTRRRRVRRAAGRARRRPRPASARSPVSDRATVSLPSGRATRPRSVRRPSGAICARPAMGVRHEPSSRASMARSAAAAAVVDASSSAASRARTRESLRRQAMATTPWPTAGNISSGSSTAVAASSIPSRRRPASASKVASTSPRASLSSRVPTLPRRGATATSGSPAQDLRGAAQRRGAHDCAGGKRVDPAAVARNPGVAWVFALQMAPENDAVGQQRRHVLERMHGDVDTPGEQRFVDFPGEQPLAADFRQRPVCGSVSRSADDRNPCRYAGMSGLKRPPRQRRLRERQWAAARPDGQPPCHRRAPCRHRATCERRHPLRTSRRPNPVATRR